MVDVVVRESQAEAKVALRSLTLSAMRWTAVGQGAALLLQVPYTVILSRVLTPADFGIVGVSAVLMRVVSYFVQAGIQSALVQATEVSDKQYRAALALALRNGAIGLLVVSASAFPVSLLMSKPAMAGILIVLGCDLVVASASAPAMAKLRRGFGFKALALGETIAFAVGYLVVGVTLALLGAAYWSLAFAALSASILRLILIQRASGLKFHPLWAPELIHDQKRFGRSVSGSYFLEFWAGSADTLAVGTWRSAADAGIYTRASFLIWFPVQQLGVVISRVLLTTFRASEAGRVGEKLTSGLVVLSSVVVPLVGIAVCGGSVVVALVLGDQWHSVLYLLPAVGVAATFNTLSQLPAVALEAQGKVRERFAAQAIQAAIVALGIAVTLLADLDIVYFAVAWCLGEIGRHVCYLWLAHGILDLKLVAVLQGYLFAIAIGAPAAGVSWAIAGSSIGLALQTVLIALSAVPPVLMVALFRSSPARRAIRELNLAPRSGSLRSEHLDRLANWILA